MSDELTDMRNGTALAIAAAALGLAACSGPSGNELSKGQTTYLTTSGTIDSRLAGDRAQTLKIGQTICAALAAGRPVSQVVTDTQRFAKGESVITKDQATRLVAAARHNLCA